MMCTAHAVTEYTSHAHIALQKSHLLIFGNSAQEDQHPIPPPTGLIPRLVHACVLLLPAAEGILHKSLPRHDWLTLVPPGQTNPTDVQLALLTYQHDR